ncbi:hypothetical protein [Pedobacter sandarakinus]|uniref:hypothetical protein n=1 Tax=Pedobacter sandarakinus TaxID=353156 RepID=UPI002246C932|nr:hypothetical protein [Pedobacter sandarakinus]MCX2574197.1 hypothetical protein [Pedobacter sandarakinus]
MKNSKTTEEQNKATALPKEKAKGAAESTTSAKDAKKVNVEKKQPSKKEQP